MSVQVFKFAKCDGSKPAKHQAFVEAIVNTRRFARSAKSQVLFEVSPGDWCLVERRHDLQSIIESGEVLRLEGDLDEATWLALWTWLQASKWRLPRAGVVRS